MTRRRLPSQVSSLHFFGRLLRFGSLVALVALPLYHSRAADGTWLGTSGTWSDPMLWSAAAPGTTGSATGNNTDTALFSVATTGTVGIDSGRNVQNMNFAITTGSMNVLIGGTGAGAGNTLFLSNAGLTQTSGTSVVTFNAPLTVSGSTYTFTNNGAGNAAPLTIGGNLDFATTGTATLTLNGTSAHNSNLVGNGVITGTIGNGTATSLTLVKSGTGSWRVSGSNTYSGGTVIDGGFLQISNSNSLGTNHNISISNGAVLQLSNAAGATPVIITSSTITLGAGGGSLQSSMAATNTNFGFDATSALLTNGNTLFLGGGAGNASVAQGLLTASGSFGGVISGGGSVIMSSTAASTALWILSGPNTYTGKTTILRGWLAVNSFNSIGTGSAANAFSSLGAPTDATSGTIDLGGTTSIANAAGIIYTGNGETTNRIVNLAATGGRTLTITQSGTAGTLKFTSDFISVTGSGASTANTLVLRGTNAGAGEIAGSIPNPTLGTTALTKNDSNTWTLSGSNSYTGATTVTGGKLIVTGTGAINPASTTTVQSITATAAQTATVLATTGTGASVGPVTINNSTTAGQVGGTVAPGDTSTTGTGLSTVGRLTANGNFTIGSVINSGSNSQRAALALEIGGTGPGTSYDQIVVTSGSVSLLTGAGILQLTTLGSPTFTQADTLFLVVNNGGLAVTGTFAAVTVGGVATDPNAIFLGGQQFQLSYTANFTGAGNDGQSNDIALVGVPEPGTWAMMTGGLGILVAFRRFKRRR